MVTVTYISESVLQQAHIASWQLASEQKLNINNRIISMTTSIIIPLYRAHLSVHGSTPSVVIVPDVEAYIVDDLVFVVPVIIVGFPLICVEVIMVLRVVVGVADLVVAVVMVFVVIAVVVDVIDVGCSTGVVNVTVVVTVVVTALIEVVFRLLILVIV